MQGTLLPGQAKAQAAEVARMRTACANVGFFYTTGHGVDSR